MKVLAAVGVILAGLLRSYGQVDLNADGAKKVTVASEIRRGADAIRGVNTKGAFMSDSDAMNAEVERNQQSNKDSEGFLLGANFYQWVKYDIWTRQPVGVGYSAVEKTLAERHARECFKQWRKAELTFGLSDEKVCELVGVKFDVIKPKIPQYDGSNDAYTSKEHSEPSREVVTLLEPVSVRVPYGTATLPRGTRLRFIARDGAGVRVQYMDSEQVIPISATDLR